MRDRFKYRGDKILGVYPSDFDRGHVSGHPGIRRVLCKREIYEAQSDHEKEIFLQRLYYAKETQLKDEQNGNKRKKKAAKHQKKHATIKEASEKWIAETRKIQSPLTANDHQRSINLYIIINGNHLVTEYDREKNIDFLNGLKSAKNLRNGETISMNSQHKHARHFKRFLNWCYESEYIDTPKKVKMPQVPTKEMETYTINEVEKLAAFLEQQATGPHRKKVERRHHNLYRAFLLARHTLLRTGALWSLKLENIDLEKGFIRIRENQELAWQPKKMKWPNKPINDTLMAFLKADLASRAPGEKYFLDNGKGGPWRCDVAGISTAMKKQCKKLGLPDDVKPFHWGIRATYITWLLNQGVDPVKVQHLADHSTLTTTMLYFNTKESSQKMAVDMLG